jgi:hypothetical protein
VNRAPIYSKRLYLVSMPQGISGFRKPSIPALVSGIVKRRDLLEDSDRFGNCNVLRWRMDDGHLPEFQPVGSYAEACDFVAANPYRAAYPLLDHSLYAGRLCRDDGSGECVECCVVMTERCPECKGIGYHEDTCVQEDDWSPPTEPVPLFRDPATGRTVYSDPPNTTRPA